MATKKSLCRKGKASGAEGWNFGNGEISIFLTKQGGQHAPIQFFADTKKPVQPYYISEWQESRPDLSSIPLLQNLRGDFFCLPFGGNGEPVGGKQYQCHGETSAMEWKEVSSEEKDGISRFTFGLDTKILPAHVEKTYELHRGESAIYVKHTVTGLQAKMPYGHHTILAMPAPEEKMFFSCGKFDLGMTPTSLFSDPKNWEYQYLASGATFKKVEAIPTLFKEPAEYDFSTYPTPVGYADLFSLLKKPGKTPAWAVAVYPRRGYLFYSLKCAAELPSTTIWVSNSGRYEAPWNGIGRCFAMEETCAYFADGWKASIRPNALSKLGWATYGDFKKDRPFTVHHIQGVARVPASFGKVKQAKFTAGAVTFTDEKGHEVTAKVDWAFLKR